VTLRQKQEYAEFLRQEKAKEAAATEAKRQAAREQELATLYTSPSAELAKAAPSGIPRLSEEILAVAIDNAFNRFREALAAEGVTLSPSGDQKIANASSANAIPNGINWTKPEAFRSLYNHMSNLGAFSDADRTITQQPQPVQPVQEKKLTLDDISLSTREGERLGKEIAFDEVTDQWAVTFRAFTDSLYRNFNGFILTDTQRRVFYDTMLRRGMDFTKPKDYDTVRVALVKSGDLPSHLLYPAEILDRDMESADLSNREVRQEFARRSRQLTQQQQRQN
jgi:hypothetical protein